MLASKSSKRMRFLSEEESKEFKQNMLAWKSSKMINFLSEEECKDLKQYNRDKINSHGYSVRDYPKLVKKGYPGMITRYYDPPAKTINPYGMNSLDDVTKFAIEHYNKIEGTNYLFKKVLKAMREVAMKEGTNYYITYQASLPDDENAETFRAKIFVPFPGLNTNMDKDKKIINVEKINVKKLVYRLIRK